MAINKNHEFEELDGIKSAIVEKNINHKRAIFLKDLLVINGYTVIIVPSPPPKVAVKSTTAEEGVEPAQPQPAETFTLGVTDVSFNSINAVFGRQLKTKDGCVVTQAVWNEQENKCDEDVPYYNYTELHSSS